MDELYSYIWSYTERKEDKKRRSCRAFCMYSFYIRDFLKRTGFLCRTFYKL